jgi:hypothetical protein
MRRRNFVTLLQIKDEAELQYLKIALEHFRDTTRSSLHPIGKELLDVVNSEIKELKEREQLPKRLYLGLGD